MEKPIIKKATEASVFMEGSEVCHNYFKTEKLTFGSSQLQPGQTGAVDTGHKNSHEVFFVVRGHVLVNCGSTFYEMFEGDAILIPPAVSHELTNIGNEIALLTWSLAPSEF